MKLPCKVIEDMLPMYYDRVCSEESAALVEGHLQDCPGCSRLLAELRGELAGPEENVDDMQPLKKIRKRYQKLRLGWLIAIVCVLVLVPAAFIVGHRESTPPVDFSQEEAIACADAFMRCLEEGDYAGAYTYWDLEREKLDLLDGALTQEELVNFEADGVKKFCQGGQKLDTWGGITEVQFVAISDASYANRYGTEEYLVSYRFQFDGKEEGFGISLTKNGIDSISGPDLIRHPLSHLSLWVQWVVDDYKGRYYDFEQGIWIEKP